MNPCRADDDHLRVWRAHMREWSDCRLCKLGRYAYRHVLGRGTIPCEVLLVGEAPGDNENHDGIPFCGPSGRLLDRMLFDSGLWKMDQFLTNAVACRPCDGYGTKWRAPSSDELRICRPRLVDIVNLCEPAQIICLGRIAEDAITLLKLSIPHIYVRHPSYLLRTGGAGTDEYRDAVTMMRRIYKKHRRSKKHGEQK